MTMLYLDKFALKAQKDVLNTLVKNSITLAKRLNCKQAIYNNAVFFTNTPAYLYRLPYHKDYDINDLYWLNLPIQSMSDDRKKGLFELDTDTRELAYCDTILKPFADNNSIKALYKYKLDDEFVYFNKTIIDKFCVYDVTDIIIKPTSAKQVYYIYINNKKYDYMLGTVMIGIVCPVRYKEV